MSEIHYQYQGEYRVASFVKISTHGNCGYYVFTLANGKQAFLKGCIVSEDLSTILWVQEHYTEHEVWSIELVQALGKAQQKYELKKF